MQPVCHKECCIHVLKGDRSDVLVCSTGERAELDGPAQKVSFNADGWGFITMLAGTIVRLKTIITHVLGKSADGKQYVVHDEKSTWKSALDKKVAISYACIPVLKSKLFVKLYWATIPRAASFLMWQLRDMQEQLALYFVVRGVMRFVLLMASTVYL